jgi:flagellin
VLGTLESDWFKIGRDAKIFSRRIFMGLRLINNINSIKAGRQLSQSNSSFSQSLERLSSGLQINKGADSPAGLIISEQLRGQIVGLKQAVDNSQKAINVVGTAEGALSEVSSLLLSIRKLAVDSSSLGSTDQDQLNANQAEVDSAINSLDRIADTTQYAGRKLLNGSSGFETSNVNSGIEKLSISRVQLSNQAATAVDYNISSAAEFGSVTVDIGAATLDEDTTLQVTGSNGSQQISLSAGSSLQDLADAVDALYENTGVTARVGTAANSLVFSSTEVGSDAIVKIEDIDGNGILIGNTASASNSVSTVSDRGADIQGSINGATAQGKGRVLSTNNPRFSGSIAFDYATAAGTGTAIASNASLGVTGRDAARVEPAALPANSTGSFDVNSEGLKFQLGAYTDPNNQESIGIENLSTYNLGRQAGRLSSLKSGGANDLTTNSDQAVKIVDEAITDVASTRARLGAFQANTLETNINSLGVAIENITSSESRIRDLDFAAETASFTKSQILVQAGTSILSQANVSAQSILRLLA